MHHRLKYLGDNKCCLHEEQVSSRQICRTCRAVQPGRDGRRRRRYRGSEGRLEIINLSQLSTSSYDAARLLGTIARAYLIWYDTIWYDSRTTSQREFATATDCQPRRIPGPPPPRRWCPGHLLPRTSAPEHRSPPPSVNNHCRGRGHLPPGIWLGL